MLLIWWLNWLVVVLARVWAGVLILNNFSLAGPTGHHKNTILTMTVCITNRKICNIVLWLFFISRWKWSSFCWASPCWVQFYCWPQVSYLFTQLCDIMLSFSPRAFDVYCLQESKRNFTAFKVLTGEKYCFIGSMPRHSSNELAFLRGRSMAVRDCSVLWVCSLLLNLYCFVRSISHLSTKFIK